MADSTPETQPGKLREGSRIQGALIFLVGLVACYLSIVLPLQEARARASEIFWGSSYAFVSVPLVLLGILAFIFPSMTTSRTFLLKSKDKLSLAGWLLIIALVAVGAATYFLVNGQLEALGYRS